MPKKTVFVTEPSLPPLEEFVTYLERIWESKRLTNAGQFNIQLEHELKEYLGVPYVSLMSNGTIALLTALQALDISGEVITTPYSFIATANSLLWNRLTPVFVDIDPKTFNIDPAKIESAITDKTSAILPVHCYGNPCDTDAIDQIAENYGLKIIYDAAHGFGVKDKVGSILNHGDLSILSFHATKVFNTFEGGAIISHTKKDKEKIDYLKNFGFKNETTVIDVGINGKMSEVNSAFGLVQLKHIDDQLRKRKIAFEKYQSELSGVKGITVFNPKGLVHNHSYCPILVESDFHESRDALYERLKSEGIYGRRYFYPLISEFEMYRKMQYNLNMVHSLDKFILKIKDKKLKKEMQRVIAFYALGAILNKKGNLSRVKLILKSTVNIENTDRTWYIKNIISEIIKRKRAAIKNKA